MARLIVMLTLFVALAAAQGRADAPERPNILWISCEDMSPDLGCYGDAQARTPNIDRMASQGVRYTQAFAFAPVCAPSRSTIITGMYATTIGTPHMRSKGVPPAYVKCFPEYLRAAGYFCTNNSKTDYNFDSPPSAWDENGKQAHWRHRPQGAPFFSVFNLTTTHESKFHMSDEELAEVIKDVRPEDRHDPAKAVLPPYYPDTPRVRKDWARYEDIITQMDLEMGQILKQLEEDGLAQSTIVFFFSDHGRGLPRGKRWVYDSGIQVPLLVRWPGQLSPGTVRDELVSFVDLAPTVLTLAGVAVPAHLQGRPFLGQAKSPPRQYVYAMRNRMDETYDTIRAVRDKRFKYIRNYEPEKPYAQRVAYGEKTPTMQEWRRLAADGKLTGPQTLFFRPTKPKEELYDVVADPHEIHDLAGLSDYQTTLAQMRQALEAWTSQTQDLGLLPENELKERMRPGGQWATTAAPRFVTDAGSSQTLMLRLECPTEGASIVYRTGEGNDKRWKLYSRPLKLERPTTVTAMACRLGWNDSEERTAGFE